MFATFTTTAATQDRLAKVSGLVIDFYYEESLPHRQQTSLLIDNPTNVRTERMNDYPQNQHHESIDLSIIHLSDLLGTDAGQGERGASGGGGVAVPRGPRRCDSPPAAAGGAAAAAAAAAAAPPVVPVPLADPIR